MSKWKNLFAGGCDWISSRSCPRAAEPTAKLGKPAGAGFARRALSTRVIDSS